MTGPQPNSSSSVASDVPAEAGSSMAAGSAALAQADSVSGFAQALETLLRGPRRDLTIGELYAMVGERGVSALIFLVCVPFLFPITIPGLSAPFAVVVGSVGLSLLLAIPPWLPAFAARRSISASLLNKILAEAIKVLRRAEKLTRPRKLWLVTGVGRRVLGLAMLWAAFLLSLPMPFVLLSNTLPALSIMFMTLALMERDGVMALLGHLSNVVTTVYFAGLVLVSGWAIFWAAESLGGGGNDGSANTQPAAATQPAEPVAPAVTVPTVLPVPATQTAQ